MSDTTFTNLALEAKGFPLTANARDFALRLLQRSVFATLLVLLGLVAIPFGAVEPWWVSLYEAAIFGLGACWSIEALVSGNWSIKEGQLLGPVVFLLAFTFLQSTTSISADPFETRLTFLKFTALALNGALLFRFISTRGRLQALTHVIIAVAIASAVFGITRQALQHNETGFLLPYLRRDSGFAQFINKNHFAFLMEMAIGLTTGLIFGGAVRRQRLLIYIAALILMWTALVLTSSRGGLFSTLAQVVFLTVSVLWIRSRVRAPDPESTPSSTRARRSLAPAIALMICLLALISTGAIWIGGDLLVTRLASLPAEITSEATEAHAGVRRREVWGATWKLIKAHPVFGSGFGAYSVAITGFHDASGKWTPEAAHNDYLELLASGGLVGAGLILWLSFTVARRLRLGALSQDTWQRAASLGAATGIFGVMAHNLVDFGLHVTANAVIFVTLVVIGTRKLRSSQSDRPEPKFRP
jgi:O-antigen ligase